MIKDFETVKKQLQELANVINNFKSEAVQLRIIELIFKGVKVVDDIEENDADSDSSLGSTPKKKRKKAIRKGDGDGKKPSAKGGKLGPKAALNQLVDDDFFKSKRTIGDIVEYCKNNLATNIKSNEISGKLASLVRAKTLKRERNSENNQYEYSNA